MGALDDAAADLRELRAMAELRGGRRRRPLFLLFGGATLAAVGGTATLITLASKRGVSGVITGIGLELESNAWSDGAGAGGAFFRLTVGGVNAIEPGVINSPWGRIGDMRDVWIPFLSTEQVLVVATNNHATDDVEACAQLEGFWTSGNEGIPLARQGRK